jgi:hypothetical protein
LVGFDLQGLFEHRDPFCNHNKKLQIKYSDFSSKQKDVILESISFSLPSSEILVCSLVKFWFLVDWT